MSSTPLLTAVGGLPGPNTLQDHPPFLRACHSPWRFIPQNILVILRGTVLAYLVAVGAMIAEDKLNEESQYSNWRHIFDFAIVTFILVFLYQLVTFSWTFTHLYYPDHDDYRTRVESWLIRTMSLPRDMASLRRQFYFTMFYTMAVVFSFMNSTIYWFITRQQEDSDDSAPSSPLPSDTSFLSQEKEIVWGWGADTAMTVPEAPFSDLFGEGWFKTFVILNLYGITSLIMVIEIFWFNSIRRPWAIVSQIFGLLFSAGIYLGWAALGKLLTDWYAFFWLDAAEVGSEEAVTLYCIGFVILAPIMYILMQGFVGIREGLTRSASEARAAAAVHAALDS